MTPNPLQHNTWSGEREGFQRMATVREMDQR